jgi:Fic family protein
MKDLPILLDGDDAAQSEEQAEDLRTLLFILGQVSLFGPTGAITLDELALSGERSKQFVRRHTRYLERVGLIETVSKLATALLS